MFISSNESFNVGGISRTPQESFGGTLPFMIHRDGPNSSFLVWTFKPFGPQPRIESTPNTYMMSNVHTQLTDIFTRSFSWFGKN